MSLGAVLFQALFEGVLQTADEWLPWPRKGKAFRAWWHAKSVVAKVWVVFCWLFMMALLTLIAVAVVKTSLS